MAPKPEKAIKAVALDMDGLLASSEDIYERVGSETLQRRGKVFDNELRDLMMGLPTPKALQLMIDFHSLDATVEEIAEEGSEIFWELAKTMLNPMPGVADFFELIDEQKIARGVVTSGTRIYAEKILPMIGVRDRVEFVITSDDIKIGKPDPEPYLMAMENFGVEPAEMVVLEDSGIGCRAGIASGAYTVAVPSTHTTQHDFTGVQFIAKTLKDPRITALFRGEL